MPPSAFLTMMHLLEPSEATVVVPACISAAQRHRKDK
jgi:hypothetical protein